MFRSKSAGALAVCLGAAVVCMSTASAQTATATSSTGNAAPNSTTAVGNPFANPSQQWEVRASDVTLSKTLERWAQAAGHKLKWDASRNFLIGAPDVYVGSFEGALQHLLSSPGIRYSDFPLEACIYANTPPLVRITRQGEQSRECAAANPQ